MIVLPIFLIAHWRAAPRCTNVAPINQHSGAHMSRLKGRTAIVTGGAVGIGKHYSEALAAQGAEVMVADIVDGSNVAADIAAKFGRNSTASAIFDVSR